ncbi:hypothetical protein BDV23DRAFT_179921 [Aspergillus alliaceus]|uniref:Uncharacterized protein n=1 Tax=Petromyces alliaceus TaxID=209559 RepID=A0A5N7CJW4_PETAA|nr:hypothetical protein BDV23DRAFT_179921 [Aspergillus alliaceus]
MPDSSFAERISRKWNPAAKKHTLIQVHSHERRDTASTSESSQENETRYEYNHQNNGGPKLWTPAVLRPLVFVAFAVLFVIILVVVQVLYSFSSRNNGLSASDPKYRYLWTYGPTAVLIIVAGIWGQVEYRTKQLMPWKSLSQTPKPASQTLLLDYVSDWNVVTLFRALKRSHWAVAVAILGTLLLKLLTVVSTGLFMLQNVHISNVSTKLAAQAAFNGTGYNSTKVDSNAALTIVGSKFLNLPHPVGTTDQYAFPPFRKSEAVSAADTIVSGTVGLFSADLNCEVAKVTNWTQDCRTQHCEQTRLNLTLSTTDCARFHFTAFMRSTSAVGGYQGDVFLEKCASASDDRNERVIFAAAHWLNNSARVQSIVCEPTYTISPGLVSLFESNQSVASIDTRSANKTAVNRMIPDVTAVDVGAGLLSTLSAVHGSIGSLIQLDNGYLANLSDPNNNYLSSFYRIATVSSPGDFEPLLDAAALEAMSRSTYKSIAAQIARQYLMTPADESLDGTYSASTKRLVVRELSVRLMEATLALLILVSGMMWLWRPVKNTPCDPGTISGLATILARSSDLSERLSGIKNRKDMKASLSDGQFTSQIESKAGQWTFRIVAEHQTKEEVRSSQSISPLSWWRPLSMTLWWRTLTLTVPLLVIAGLETTYQISQQHNGLTDVRSDGYIRYTWVYIPAFIMILIQALFDGTHFSTQVIQPYVDLRRGGRTAQESLMDNYLSKLTVHSLWSALAKMKYAISATALTMVLAPCLTIAASGLYSTEDVSFVRAVSISRSDTFNLTVDPKPFNPTHRGIGLTGALVVATNVSYPDWTYDELVFPALKENSLTDVKRNALYKPTNQSSAAQSIFDVTLPALRAGLNCTALEANQILRAKTFQGSPTTSVDVFIGDNCTTFSQKLDNGTIFRSYDVAVTTNATDRTRTVFGAFRTTEIIYKNPGCPSMIGLYGVLTNPNSTDGIRGFTCTPYVDVVDVDTKFALPGLKINKAKPDESSSRRFANSDNFASQLAFNMFLPQSTAEDEALDIFFAAMIKDQKTLVISDVEQADRLPAVVNATQHLYRVLMAQSLNGNSRLPPQNETIYNGTVMDPTRVRLQQSGVSTRILEGFLAAMVLCTLVAFYLLRTREVIPVNPSSIAGAATLLAGSEMLKPDVIPPGSEWYNDKELVKRGVFSGLMFGLGLWEGKRFGIDIGRPEE